MQAPADSLDSSESKCGAQAGDVDQVVELVVVDVAHHADVQAALAQRLQGVGDAVAQDEVAPVQVPLHLPVALEVRVIGPHAEGLEHAGERVAEEVAVQVEAARQVGVEDAPHRLALGAADLGLVGLDARPARQRQQALAIAGLRAVA